MDRKSKALSIIIALAVIASIGTTFYRTIILKDFTIIENESEESIEVEDVSVEEQEIESEEGEGVQVEE